MSYLSQFHHQFYGPENGRRWIFVHGLMGYGQNWRKIIAGLEATERCLTFDQRGHGRSMKPAAGYATEDYAFDLLQIIEELGWEDIILVGHSLGGRNVLNFTSRFPQRIQKLVIEDIGAEANTQVLSYYQNLLGAVPTPFADRAQAKKFFAEDFHKTVPTRENSAVLAPYFYSNLEEKENGQLDWRFLKSGILESVKAGRGTERWDEVKALNVPTLLVRGEHSDVLTREIYERMLTSNSMIKGVVIPEAGHWVHSDRPEQFLTELKSFVVGF